MRQRWRRAAATRVLVTGGTGFIGRRVVKELIGGGYTVRCLLRRRSASNSRLDGLAIERCAGDIHDRSSLDAALDGCDACIHLAAKSAWTELAGDGVNQSIVGGTENVVAACRNAGGVRLLYCSSVAAVNGSLRPRIFDERAAFGLDGTQLHYALAKHAAEQIVTAAHARGLDTVIVNPAETYGPGDVDWITAGTLRDFLQSRPAFAVNGGTSIVHVDDVARGLVLALEHGRSGERYILGGENLSIPELARRTLAFAGRRGLVVVVPGAVAAVAVNALARLGATPPVAPALLAYARRFWYVSSAKACDELGYRYRDADATLKPVVEWILDQKNSTGAQK